LKAAVKDVRQCKCVWLPLKHGRKIDNGLGLFVAVAVGELHEIHSIMDGSL